MAFISFQPKNNFKVKLWTGTGASHAITGVGFQPDFIWIKARDYTFDHVLTDVVRGATYQMNSNNFQAQTNRTDEVTSFDSDGFTLGVDSAEGVVNNSGNTYVGWNWKLGGTASSNTDGDVTTTVSANTTTGVSIVKWSGSGATSTIGHGLGKVPNQIFIKNLDSTNNWQSYQAVRGNGKKQYLNAVDAVVSSGWMNSTAPTSSVFTVTNDADINSSGVNYYAMCFTSVKGFSYIDTYTGTAQSDGPFIHTGFRPSLIIIKNCDNTNDWAMYDNSRLGYNDRSDPVYANLNNAETNTGRISIMSNGFKINSTSSQVNESGSSYVCMAFAEFPFVSSNGKAGVGN